MSDARTSPREPANQDDGNAEQAERFQATNNEGRGNSHRDGRCSDRCYSDYSSANHGKARSRD